MRQPQKKSRGMTPAAVEGDGRARVGAWHTPWQRLEAPPSDEPIECDHRRAQREPEARHASRLHRVTTKVAIARRFGARPLLLSMFMRRLARVPERRALRRQERARPTSNLCTPCPTPPPATIPTARERPLPTHPWRTRGRRSPGMAERHAPRAARRGAPALPPVLLLQMEEVEALPLFLSRCIIRRHEQPRQHRQPHQPCGPRLKVWTPISWVRCCWSMR